MNAWVRGLMHSPTRSARPSPVCRRRHRQTFYAVDLSRTCTPQAEPSPITWAQAHLRVLDLALSGLAAEVVTDLPYVCDAGAPRWDGPWTPGRLTRSPVSSRHPPGRTRLEEIRCAAFFAQHQVVVVHQFGGGEAIVQFDEIEVGRRRCPPARMRWLRPFG